MAHISTEEMFSLADGDLKDEEKQRIIEHITSCERCKRKMEGVLAFNKKLGHFWDDYLSKKCPDEDTLFSYFQGKLEGEQLRAVAEHVSKCPVCRHKIESAEESLATIDQLDVARERLAPSIINRLKQRLEKIEIKKIIDGLEKAIDPTRLGEEFFDFLSKGAQILAYALAKPLEVPALLPVTAGGVKLAETGRGFQRKVIVEEGLPFEVELVQFGDRFILNLKSRYETHQEALVRYIIQEKGQTRRQGVLVVSEGKAALQLSEEDIEALRPEESPLNLKLEVLLKRDVFSGLLAEDVISLVERLHEIMESEDPEMAEAALEALQTLEGMISGEH
jgi:hypothetical protein